MWNYFFFNRGGAFQQWNLCTYVPKAYFHSKCKAFRPHHVSTLWPYITHTKRYDFRNYGSNALSMVISSGPCFEGQWYEVLELISAEQAKCRSETLLLMVKVRALMAWNHVWRRAIVYSISHQEPKNLRKAANTIRPRTYGLVTIQEVIC